MANITKRPDYSKMENGLMCAELRKGLRLERAAADRIENLLAVMDAAMELIKLGLCDRARQLLGGDLMPTTRDIAQETGIPHDRVIAAIGRLVDRGLVVCARPENVRTLHGRG